MGSANMAVKVTLEFENVDAAIVGLSKLVGTSQASKAQPAKSPDSTVVGQASQPSKRRGRSDKGQPRGSYKVDATTNAAGAGAPAVATDPVTVSAAVTDPGNAGTAATPTSTVADKVSQATQEAGAPPAVAPAATLTDKDAQAAVSKLFEAKGLQIALQVLSRFGARVVRELKPTQYAEFVQKVNDVLNGGEV